MPKEERVEDSNVSRSKWTWNDEPTTQASSTWGELSSNANSWDDNSRHNDAKPSKRIDEPVNADVRKRDFGTVPRVSSTLDESSKANAAHSRTPTAMEKRLEETGGLDKIWAPYQRRVSNSQFFN
jgi:hypothetical protein